MAKTEIAIVTEIRDGELMPIPLLAAAVILQGTFAVVDGTGHGIASDDVGGADQICLGIWDQSAENTGANGDLLGLVRRNKSFWCATLQLIQSLRRTLVFRFMSRITKPLQKRMVQVLVRSLVVLWVLIRNLMIASGWRFKQCFLMNKQHSVC